MFANKLEVFQKSFKKNYFPLILTFLIGFVGILPLIIQPTSPFFSIDPDPAYVANALEYLQIHKIFIVDHPGVPMTMFLAMVFFPIKIFEKLTSDIPFALWSVQNFSLFMWIARFSVFGVFLTGIYILQFTFYKYFKSYFVNLFLTLVLLLVPYFFTFQGLVTPEIFGLFFTSIWFYFITKYIVREEVDFLVLASVFSGFAAASKMTFVFVFVSTFIISLYKKSIRKSLYILAAFASSFFVGTFTVLKDYDSIQRWLSYLFVRESAFDVTSIVGTNWFGTNYIFLILVAVLILIVHRKKELKVFIYILLSAFVGFFVFAKYSSLHYQFANFLLVALCLTMLFAQLRKKEMAIILIFLSFFSIKQVLVDFQIKRNLIISSANIQKFSNNLPADGFYIWDIVGSEEYSLIRGKEWSNWFYRDELKSYRPNLWYLYPANLGVIINNEGQRYSISDFCWNGLFLNKDNFENFLSLQKFPENYNKVDIPGTNILFVTQTKCSKTIQPQELNI